MEEKPPWELESLAYVVKKMEEMKKMKRGRLGHEVGLVDSMYKILAKVLATRVKKVMEKIIGPNQMAFVKNRHIVDNFMVTEKVIHSWKKDNIEGLLMKLDFERAYDCVNHAFLDAMMAKMGIGSKWRGVVFGRDEVHVSHLQFVDDLSIEHIFDYLVNAKRILRWAAAFCSPKSLLPILYLSLPLDGTPYKEDLNSVMSAILDALACSFCPNGLFTVGLFRRSLEEGIADGGFDHKFFWQGVCPPKWLHGWNGLCSSRMELFVLLWFGLYGRLVTEARNKLVFQSKEANLALKASWMQF
ncbi:hypothetical protein Ddye_000490 [Dipteronia dyeriana]|uniref:Reverse transcriptase domain-containing protein n=1 Tax=Dipteronia dyeriana TaxID=168575 RepID=A0AAE0CSL6_9ROSI|nr:hypothetical protein Ddye_000490 [Dipteronia dyeriana]